MDTSGRKPRAALGILTIVLTVSYVRANTSPPLLDEGVVTALAEELSGTQARRHVQSLSLHHRMRGSRAFLEAATYIRSRAESYGLAVDVISLPADGKIFYGTQRSRPAWDADFAELWELRPGETPDTWIPVERIASWSTRPVTLAQDSAAGTATADLVDVGEGTSPEDYEGKDVKGRLVLAGAQPGVVARLAVEKHGAVGIISYAPNQRSAWWREDETLVRWGHMETFPETTTFAFMVSLQQARSWQERLAGGERVRLQAEVIAGQRPGSYEIVTGVLPGSDPAVRDEEIVFSCHLDHQRPGANDNASGCAAILEIARTIAKLVGEKKIDPPRRSIRFVWPPEIEGTIALLNARPELASRAAASIHLDMVGGDPDITKAVFHVTRSPKSLPTFINDVSEAFGRFANDQSNAFAGGKDVPWPLVDPEGGKEALLGLMVDFTMGSDHQVWAEGSWRVPVIYMNDWPDRYIHTHRDGVANIDPTKLLRAGFIGAASGVYLASLDEEDVPRLWNVMARHSLERTAAMLARQEGLEGPAARNLARFHLAYEAAVVDSIERFAAIPEKVRAEASRHVGLLQQLIGPGGEPTAGTGTVYRRRGGPKGPMNGFGYNYLEDQVQQHGLTKPELLSYEGAWGKGPEYAYEALNLIDGDRTVQQVRDDLSAIYGEVPLDLVAGYLDVLETIGVVARD